MGNISLLCFRLLSVLFSIKLLQATVFTDLDKGSGIWNGHFLWKGRMRRYRARENLVNTRCCVWLNQRINPIWQNTLRAMTGLSLCLPNPWQPQQPHTYTKKKTQLHNNTTVWKLVGKTTTRKKTVAQCGVNSRWSVKPTETLCPSKSFSPALTWQEIYHLLF